MRYDVDTGTVMISVGELCALAHRSGHLDAAHPQRLTNAPKHIDARYRAACAREKGYTADVLVRNTVTHHGICYTVEGVADGVITENGRVTVEEIKSVRPRNFLRGAPREDAYSRLRCYACFLSVSEHLRRVSVRIRLINAENGEMRDICSEATADELYAFYLGLLDRIEPFAKALRERYEQRLPSVADIKFPYPHPREGQVELAERCFRTIRRGGRLFAQAPTGIGKTMSTLYPAVKALGEGHCDRVFYLTAKASTRREAYAAAARLFQAGAALRTVVLYAKEQMCLREGGCRTGGTSHCNAVDCPYAKGYYDRIDRAVFELLQKQNGFPRASLLEAARIHGVCPYELSLDLSEFCEIIICDYNYAFDPNVYLRRYFDAEGERGSYAFLVDEAHNLPDRMREIYTTRLCVKSIEDVYARVDPIAEPALEEGLGGLLLGMHRMARLCTENRQKHEDGSESGYYIDRALPENLMQSMQTVLGKLESFVKKEPDHPLAEGVDALCGELRRFLFLGECYDSHFLTYAELIHGKVSVQIICLDPSGVLNAAMHRAKACILFSATLAPLDYFVDLLGGSRVAEKLELPSPYDPERLCVTVASGVSTRMEDRERSYRKVANLIAATVSAKAGNYIVYFPSYEYMEKVLEQFLSRYPEVPHIVQHRHMNLGERDAFLDFFRQDEGKLRIGFCVLGGSFSEGVDLPGSRLIGVVVVGVGIPGLSNERNILRDYYENKCERGYDYAYVFPGMNRVLQAAGRVIRREEDRGVVVLIDDRYAEEPYLHLYPGHWKGLVSASTAGALAGRLRQFWQENKDEEEQKAKK